jgi:hypothetical protein
VAGILSPPILADVFRCFVQPIRVSQQGDQFDGAKEFHRVGFLLAERPQFPRAGENGDIVRSSSITNMRRWAAQPVLQIGSSTFSMEG